MSTTFVGWILKNGSTVYEDHHQQDLVHGHDEHANTYLQVKCFAENCVSALLAPQPGQPRHGKVVRILRLTTLSPAVEFPRPGWGAGRLSSPISGIIAAKKIPREYLDSWMPEDAVLDGR